MARGSASVSSVGRASSMKRFLCGLVVLGLPVAVNGQAMAQPSYIYTTLDVPGSFDTLAQGINASGQIVGSYNDAAANLHGFLLDNGNYTTLDGPGSTGTEASGVNASGQIVGTFHGAYGEPRGGFLLDNGNY